MKTTERINVVNVEAENSRFVTLGVVMVKQDKEKQNKAFFEITYRGAREGIVFFNEEQLQDLLDGLTIVKNELHKRNSSKRQKKKKPAPKPKKEIEVQMLLVNPIPIL